MYHAATGSSPPDPLQLRHVPTDMDGKEAAMSEWTPGVMVGILVIGVGVMFLIWRYAISEWRAHRRDRREERREDRGPR
jgi:hypothetical protein